MTDHAQTRLEPCPFCGKELYRNPRHHNPKAYCVTEDCYGKRMSVVNLDDPIIVAMWNSRALAAAPPSDSPGSAQQPQGEPLMRARKLVSGFMLPERITDPELADDLAQAIAQLLSAHQPQGGDAREAAAQFIQKVRQYNASYLAYVLSHDEAVNALLALAPAPVRAAAEPGEMRPEVDVEALADWFYNNGHEFVISDEEEVARTILDKFEVRPRAALSPASANEEPK